MAGNEYEEIVSGGKVESAGNPYIDMIQQDEKPALQQSMFVASQKDPEKEAEVIKLSERAKVPKDVVDKNFEEFRKRAVEDPNDLDSIIKNSPKLAGWLKNPENATVSKGDLATLNKIETSTSRLSTLPKELSHAFYGGSNQLGASMMLLGAAYGKGDPDALAEAAARANRAAQDMEAKKPTYAKEFQNVFSKEYKDVESAARKFLTTNYYQEISEGNIMNALKGFGAGGQTVGEFLDFVYEVAKRPRGLLYGSAEQIPNMAPSLVLGAGGAKLGAVTGGGVGTLTAPLTGPAGPAVGAGVGGTAGFLGGSFAGSYLTEVGSWINQRMSEKGFDTTNADDIRKALADGKLMEEIRGEAERKGLGTAGVDVLFNAFAGKFLGGLGKEAKLTQKLAAGVKEVAVQGVGEGVSEASGQALAYKDVSKINFEEAMQEAVFGWGHAVGDVVVGHSVRSLYPEKPTEAVKHIVNDAENAANTIHDVQLLKEIGEQVKESKTAERLPEKIKDFVNTVGDSSVYFNQDDWDSYWNKKGKSPAKAAEQILGDGGKKYTEARDAGTPIEIPVSDLVSKAAKSEDYDGILEMARTEPDGMKFEEAREFHKNLPATLEELAKEASTVTEDVVAKEAKDIGNSVKAQLQAAGQNATDASTNAKLYEAMFSTLAYRTGQTPKQIFDVYGLKIGNVEDKGGAKAMEQGGKRGQIVFGKNRIDINLLKNADPSTFAHETGHFYLEVLGDIASQKNVPAQIKEDYQTILDWLGVKDRSQIKKDQHEQWARGFEAYLMEGKAPSTKLKQAFARFKVWLTSVYKSMLGLNVELSDSVKDVMNRILATDQEIAEAQGKYPALFKGDPITAGMPKDMAARYLDVASEAMEYSASQLRESTIEDLNRKKEKFYKDEKASVKEKIETELLKAPNQQTLTKLSEGEVKVNSSEKIAGLPKEMFSKDGESAQVVAEAFGFKTSAEFLDAMKAAQDQRTKGLDAAVEAEMQKRYPDGLFELEDKAIEALHNEKRAKQLRIEADFLAKQAKGATKNIEKRLIQRLPPDKLIKDQALKTIANRQVGDIKPYLFERAERKAAKEAADAFGKKDFQAAFDAKKKELLNHELFKAAIDAQREVEKQIKDKKKLFKSDEAVSKSRDVDLVNAARAVLAEYGITRADKKAAEYLNAMRTYDPDAYNTMIALVNSAVDEGGKNYKSLTYDKFTEVMAAVDALWSLSKTKNEITVDGQKMQVDALVAQLSNRINEIVNGDPDQPDGKKKKKAQKEYRESTTPWEQTKIKFLGTKAKFVKISHWSNAMGGMFKAAFRNKIFEAATNYRVNRIEATKAYEALLVKYKDIFDNEPIAAPELGFQFKNKSELLMAMAHTGNDSNFSKFIRGWKFGEQDIDGNIDVSKWNKFMQRMYDEKKVTFKDHDFVQGVWDLMESFKADTQKAHKNMFGFYFNEITATPFSVKIGEETREYKGGYVPAKVDIYESQDAEIRHAREEFEKNNVSFAFPTTGKGATMTRNENYAAPLSLNMGMLMSHIDWAMRFTYLEPSVKEVARVANDRNFREAMKSLDPQIVDQAIIPWLSTTAKQQVVLAGEDRFFDAALSYIRKTTAMQALTFNIPNYFQQFIGTVIATVKVKPRHMRDAMASYITNHKTMTAEMIEKSKFMSTLQGTSIFEAEEAIKEITTNPSTFKNIQNLTKKHMSFFNSATQNVTNTVVWWAGYNQGIENNLTDEQAIKHADEIVEMTQGTPFAEGASRMEVGTPFKRLFVMFYNYFNMVANLNAFEIQKIAREQGVKKGFGNMFYVYTMGFAIPAMLNEAIRRAFAGKGLDEDDDDKYLDDVVDIALGSQARLASTFIPGLGSAYNAMINRFNNKPYDDRMSLSPAFNALETTVGLPYEAYKATFKEGANKKKVTKDALNLLGTATGLPIGPLGKPAGYIIDRNNNKIKPKGKPGSLIRAVDTTRGLLTGQGDRRK